MKIDSISQFNSNKQKYEMEITIDNTEKYYFVIDDPTSLNNETFTEFMNNDDKDGLIEYLQINEDFKSLN